MDFRFYLLEVWKDWITNLEFAAEMLYKYKEIETSKTVGRAASTM